MRLSTTIERLRVAADLRYRQLGALKERADDLALLVAVLLLELHRDALLVGIAPGRFDRRFVLAVELRFIVEQAARFADTKTGRFASSA